MGVRGAARREQKPRPKLGKPVMKPYSPIPPPPSASTPPTSPTPPPSLVPEPDQRPRLRRDLPPAHAKDLQPAHNPEAQSISRNLLISPVKANRARNPKTVQRQPSSRIANNANKQVDPEQDPDEEAFTVEFRVYPFPPSTRPLCYPLDQVPHPTGSHAESDSPVPSRKDALRKRLLKRWRDDLAAKEKAEVGSTLRDTPSDASQRQLTDSPRVTRKRGRSPPPVDESDDDVPVIHTMSGVAHSMASAPFDLDEGDPVLPMIGASRTVEVRSNGSGRREARGDSTEFGRLGSQERLSKYSRVGDRDTVKRQPRYSQPVTSDHVSLPPSLRASENERNSGKTMEDGFSGGTHRKNGRGAVQEATSEEVHVKPTENALEDNSLWNAWSQLEALKNRIYILKERRRSLEQKELDEISKEAARNSSVTVTKEDRIRLKEEIETLSKHAVRDLLRLISRRMQGLESSPQAEVKEVKLPLDSLPADLTKELRLMVLRQKGQLAFPASDELQKVRAELRELVREYRRQRNLVDA